MFSFLKRKISASDVGDVLFETNARDFAKGYDGKWFPEGDEALSTEIVTQEWLYLHVFAEDLCVFLLFAKRHMPTKNAILDRFWSRIREYLLPMRVPGIPARQTLASNWPLRGEG
jgi:hypothetical protein